MAPPPKAKLRKRKNNNSKKSSTDDNEDEVIDMFGLGTGNQTGQSDFDFPMPPQMGQAMAKDKQQQQQQQQQKQSKGPTSSKKKNDDEDDDDDDDDDDDNMNALPSKSKSNNKTNNVSHPQLAKADKGGIKMGPLILLLIMFGTTLIPVFLFVGDSLTSVWSKTNIIKSVGYQLGMGPVPRQRVISFYEKHNPDKLSEVPKVLRSHYGDYPKLIRKLERKYQDYGYFMGWEDDEAPAKIVKEQLAQWYSIWIQKYWNVYMPVWVRTRVRNVKYNLNGIYKQGRKMWRKYVWPYLLEPIFGVPDERTAEKQKRQDAKRRASQQQQQQQKQQRQPSSKTTRRRNTEFRDNDGD